MMQIASGRLSWWRENCSHCQVGELIAARPLMGLVDMLPPDPRQNRRCQARNPVIGLLEFPEPALHVSGLTVKYSHRGCCEQSGLETLERSGTLRQTSTELYLQGSIHLGLKPQIGHDLLRLGARQIRQCFEGVISMQSIIIGR